MYRSRHRLKDWWWQRGAATADSASATQMSAVAATRAVVELS
jgi:hypothetical protein